MSSNSDPLSDFRSAVSRHFEPIAVQFGLGACVEKIFGHEIYIDFRGTSARLCVAFGLDSSPWVYIAVPTASGHERQFGLHTIVEHHAGTRQAFDALAEVADLETQVRVLSDLTRTYAASVLEGEPADLRALYLLKKKALREREQHDSGFTHQRPTLAELFTGVDRPELQLICAYHAVVDHDFTVSEVATFLGIQPDGVQDMIDRHDTIK